MAVAAWFGERMASTQVAAADLSTKQFYFVSVGSSGANVNTTTGAGALKVLGNAPKVNEACYLHDIGETKVVAGGTITAGGLIMSDSSGKAIAFVDNGANVAIGEARMSAVSGDVFTAFTFPTGSKPLAVSNASGLIAAGTTQTDALALSAAKYQQVSSAAASTGVKLTAALYAGQEQVVINDGANAIKAYGNGSDTIDGTAGATGVTITNAKRALFVATAAGAWVSLGFPGKSA